MSALTKIGWVVFGTAWVMVLFGIFSQEWVRCAAAGPCFLLSVFLLWEGSHQRGEQ